MLSVIKLLKKNSRTFEQLCQADTLVMNKCLFIICGDTSDLILTEQDYANKLVLA